MDALKPDPAGWRVIRGRFGDCAAVVVGDAAAAAGVPFVAYRPNAEDLARWQVKPLVTLHDLAALPTWLTSSFCEPSNPNGPQCEPQGGWGLGPRARGELMNESRQLR